MKIGIYGGTFNPPHAGHLQGAKHAAEELKLDRMLLIPGGIAPHKQLPEGSPSGKDRLRMLQLAIGDDPILEACDVELQQVGTSYTYLTVKRIRKENPEAELFLLMGSDMFLVFHQWKNPAEIMKEVTLVVMSRGLKSEKQEIARQKEKLEAMGAKVIVCENPVVEISSTNLRRLLAFRAAGEFLPKPVLDYILTNGLYDTDKDYRNLPMQQLEPVVAGLLKANRVAHVMGVRDTAEKLAVRWGANVVDAGRAGILHDITKALDGPLQLTLCREYGTMLDAFSQENPKTLHALTGALVADKIFGENEAVVEAIRSHTTGKANMNLLQKIVYVADYMEPNRDFPGVEKLRELAFSDLDAALQLGLQMTIDMLTEQGRTISPASREALAYLKQNHKG